MGVLINGGTESEEVNEVKGFGYMMTSFISMPDDAAEANGFGSILLADPLKFDHVADATVTTVQYEAEAYNWPMREAAQIQLLTQDPCLVEELREHTAAIQMKLARLLDVPED